MKFSEAVIELTKHIPAGQVATYGQIAAAAGQPRAARMVGWILARSGSQLPWQRVINRQGMVSIENMGWSKEDQATLLRKDGVEVELREGNYYIDLQKYLVDGAYLSSIYETFDHP